ncbi:hypothetical protein [Chishuiella sp.]|uniref:hypothetical protein n=1 Tax=Chishuiella sp. TaxID=1969467 RepID=UPI0028B1A94F|nr:hypothetical protein [Chishuiella sp.]
MRKVIIFISIILTFTSCKSQSDKAVSKELKIKDEKTKIQLPLGDEKLIKYNFPRHWESLPIDDLNTEFNINNISTNGYDSAMYFIDKTMNKLYVDFKINKNKSLDIPFSEFSKLLSYYDSNVKLDSMYYVGELKKTSDYSLNLYKNGKQYEKFLIPSDDQFSFNYLCLVTMDNSNTPIDYKLIFYYNNISALSYNRSYYIDKDSKIYFKDFYIEDQFINWIDAGTYIISSKGKFEKINL